MNCQIPANQPAKPVVLIAALAGGLLLDMLLPTAVAAEPPAPDRIALTCIEQPSHQVSFSDAGPVDYTEVAAHVDHPVTLTIVKTTGGESYPVEPARIESSEPWLERNEAVWTRGVQVDASNGQLRINLDNLKLFLTEPGTDGSARFRRFHCERITDAEQEG